MVSLTPRDWNRRVRLLLLTAVCLAAGVRLLLAPRTPIGPGYHLFADTRTLCGLPNALNALSNIPFFVVGLGGITGLLSRPRSGLNRRRLPLLRLSFLDPRERTPYLIFFTGVMFTGIGSFWYHLHPSDARLPWDLLPMTCSFVALVAATWMERAGLRSGLLALAPALLLGMSTVLWWVWSGDYRYYLFLQYFSPVVLVLLIALFPPRYTGLRFLVIAFGCYLVAKFFEEFDLAIYRHLAGAVSGHTLKHLTAGIACLWILAMLGRRRSALVEEEGVRPASVFARSGA